MVASAVMGIIAWLLYFLISRLMGELSWSHYLISMIPSMIIGVIAYLIAAIKLRAVTAEDMDLIPKGEKISKLVHLRCIERKILNKKHFLPDNIKNTLEKPE